MSLHLRSLLPTKLWLECLCDKTALGDELVVVGGHPALGSWRPEHGVVLTTTPSLFPRWTLKAPLVLHGARTPSRWHFKYVIRGSDGSCHWEDLGARTQVCYDFDEPVLVSEVVNREVETAAGRLVVRLDRFDCGADSDRAGPLAEAVWRLPIDWDPHRADLGHMFGDLCCLRGSSQDIRSSASSELHSPHLPPDCGLGATLEAIAARAFAEPGQARVRGALSQLRRCRRLPAGVWCDIGSFLRGDLGLKQAFPSKQ